MRGTEVYRLLSGAASQATTEANVRFLKQYHHDVNDMFARLHAASHNPVGSSGYDAERAHYMQKQIDAHEHSADPHLGDKRFGKLEYTRYTFERRSEANRFVAEMKAQGVEVTLAPVRIHGQIMIEIPREMKQYNEDGSERGTIQTSTIVHNYSAKNGVEVNTYKASEDYGDSQQSYTQGTVASAEIGIIQNEFLSQIPEVAAAHRFITELESFSTRYGDTNQKHAFLQTVRHDGIGEAVGGGWSGAGRDNVRATVLKGDGSATVRISEESASVLRTIATDSDIKLTKSQQAFLEKINGRIEEGSSLLKLNFEDKANLESILEDVKIQGKKNDIFSEQQKSALSTISIKETAPVVIIDGKEVTDPEIVSAVLGHHNRRSELVRTYAGQYADASQALDWSSSTSGAPVSKDAKRTQLRFSDTNERIETNARDIGRSIKNQSYAVGGFEYGKKFGRFDDGEIGAMRNSFGKEAIMLKKTAGEVEITEDMLVVLNKVGLHPNNNLTHLQKDFLANITAGTAVFTYEDKINMVDIIENAANFDDAKHVLSADERKLLNSMNAEAEAGGQFRLSKEDSIMFSFETKKQLDALREDFGIDLDFKSNYLKNINQSQLTHINISLESELAKQGITFDAATAKFMDKTGKALTGDDIVRALASSEDGLKNVLRINELNPADKVRLELFKKTGDVSFINQEFSAQLERAGISISAGSVFINTHGKDISEFDILKLDKAFLLKAQDAGFNFITVAGTFDVKSLMAVKNNPADLAKLKAAGISEKSLDAMIRFHKNDGGFLKQLNYGRTSASWGNSKHSIRNKAFKGGMGGITKLAGGGSKLIGEGDQETQQAVQAANTLVSAKGKVQQAAAYTRQFSDAVNQRVDAFKARHARGQGHEAPARGSVKTKKNKASTRKANQKTVEKKITRDEKKVARMQASKLRMEKLEKLMHRFDLKGRAMEYVATKTAIGKAVTAAMGAAKAVLIKAVGVFLAVYFVIAAVFLVIIIAISMIQALLDAPYHGMKKVADWWGTVKGEEAAIIELYKYMDGEIQVGWLKDLNDYGTQYKNRNDINYTLNYTDADSYVGGIADLYKDGDTWYLNPFYKGGNTDTDAMTKVTAFDGKNDTVLMANASVYGAKNEDGTISTESGHTNNIKDILAMVDVNYQFDINTFSDDGLEEILGEKPSVIQFENVYNKVTGFFKWAGKCVVHLFGGDDEDEYPKLEDYWGGTVSYGTIQNYCDTLYRASHQEQVSLTTEYYQMKPVNVNIGGTEKDVSDKLTQQNASYLDVCNDPVVKSYKLAWNGSYIYPYILDADGNKIDLSKYSSSSSGNVVLKMDETSTTGHLVSGETPCLWKDMGEDKATYDEISSRVGYDIIGDPCWSRESKVEDYESYTATGGWYDSKGDAKDDAVGQVKAKSDEYKANPPAVAKEFTMNADRTSFIRIWKEGCYKNENVTYEEDNYVPDGTKTITAYWCNSEHSSYGGSDCGYGNAYMFKVDGKVVANVDYNGSDGNYYTVDSSNNCIVHYWDRGSWHDYNAGDNKNSHSWGYEDYTWDVPKYKTQYKATCTANVICQYTETFKRDCDGHKFTYCGGHIACHVKGMVYSATNEQLALGGMYIDEDAMPKAKGYVLADHGFETIRGKVIKKEVDYDGGAYQASITGGCKSPVEDVQGSDVNRGLNIYVTSSGDFCKDMKFREDLSPQVFRDIFDIDSAIDKGNNVFPWKPEKDGGKGWKGYEGWTADNIQFVAMKLSIDWNDLYGFDAPLEIGAVTISEKDIELLNDALAKEYGSHFTETRKEAVDYALRWVGRGHYSKDHSQHDFLDGICQSHSFEHIYGGKKYYTCYDANCTAGSSEDFVNCYLGRFNKTKICGTYSSKWQTTSNVTSSAYPADVIRHQNVSEWAYKNYAFADSDVSTNGGEPLRKGLLELKDRDAYQIYIGTLTKIFDEQGVDEIELQNGYIIKKGVPITIDLSPSSDEGGIFGLAAKGANGSGSVFFRSENSSGYGETKNTENFYWLLNDTANTKYARFE